MIFVMFAFIGVQQLIFKKKLQINYFLAFLFWAGGYNMLYFWGYSIGLLRTVPLLLNTEIAAAFLIGPSLYLYFSALMGDGEIPFKSVILHGLPFLASLATIISLNIFNDSIRSLYEDSYPLLPDYSSNTLVFVINTIADFSIAVYFLAAACKTISILKKRKITKETKSIIFFLIFFSLSSSLLMIAGLVGNRVLQQLSLIVLSILPMGFIFFSFRYPDYTIKVIKETRLIRKSKADMLRRTVNPKSMNLDQLMRDFKFYRQPDLTLNSLSRRLSLTPHELSHILNNDIRKNFNSYINFFRIEEAKSMLLGSNDKNISEIAYHVGFNSTSSFYRSFIKETGIPPMRFKKDGT